jgi:hypothetical protein
VASFNDVFRVMGRALSYDIDMRRHWAATIRDKQRRSADMGASSFGIGRGRRPLPRTPAPIADVIRKQTRAFEIAEYEAVLMAQGEEDVIASLEALTLAAAHEMRRRAPVGRPSPKRRGGRVR